MLLNGYIFSPVCPYVLPGLFVIKYNNTAKNGGHTLDNKFCAFLRGVNVKGTAMKMDKLKEAFKEMGFENCKTILATGNVIFVCDNSLTGGELRAFIEQKLSSFFDYDANVFIRSAKEVTNMVTAGNTISHSEDNHLYVLISDEKELLLELRELFNKVVHEPGEEFIVEADTAFWTVPKGSTLSSEFGSKVLGSKKYKSALTSRNQNTMEKVLAAMNVK